MPARVRRPHQRSSPASSSANRTSTPPNWRGWAGWGFDVILGAVHRIEQGPVSALASGYAADTLFRLYYEGRSLAAVRRGAVFQVMAHLDFPKRHTGCTCDLPDLVDEILSAMLENGILPEINTSTCDREVKECCPDVTILSRWAALGGQRVVTGSDAHSVNAVAAISPKRSG